MRYNEDVLSYCLLATVIKKGVIPLYVLTKEQLIEHDAFEFIRGNFCGEHWLDSSIFIAEDIFQQAELNHIFSLSMSSFAYYGITVVTEKDWIRTKNAAQSYPSQMTVSIIKAIDNWAKECFKEESCFTICGI